MPVISARFALGLITELSASVGECGSPGVAGQFGAVYRVRPPTWAGARDSGVRGRSARVGRRRVVVAWRPARFPAQDGLVDQPAVTAAVRRASQPLGTGRRGWSGVGGGSTSRRSTRSSPRGARPGRPACACRGARDACRPVRLHHRADHARGAPTHGSSQTGGAQPGARRSRRWAGCRGARGRGRRVRVGAEGSPSAGRCRPARSALVGDPSGAAPVLPAPVGARNSTRSPARRCPSPVPRHPAVLAGAMRRHRPRPLPERPRDAGSSGPSGTGRLPRRSRASDRWSST